VCGPCHCLLHQALDRYVSQTPLQSSYIFINLLSSSTIKLFHETTKSVFLFPLIIKCHIHFQNLGITYSMQQESLLPHLQIQTAMCKVEARHQQEHVSGKEQRAWELCQTRKKASLSKFLKNRKKIGPMQ